MTDPGQIINSGKGFGNRLLIQESDGSPSGFPRVLKFNNGSVVDNGDGSFTIDVTGLSTAPAGNDTYVQFNDGGAFGGDAGMTWNKTTNALTLTGPFVCTTINTGQGVTELYLMNQNVRTTDSPTFATLTLTGNLVMSDNDEIRVGTGTDLTIVHDGTNTKINNVTGILKLNPTAASNITCFEDTDIANDTNGKQFIVYRKAAEGDDSMIFYIDKDRIAQLHFGSASNQVSYNPAAGMFFRSNDGSQKMDFDVSGLNIGQTYRSNNPYLIQYGRITAAAAQKYIQFVINDTTDYYELTREDTNILGFSITFPTKMAGTIKAISTKTNDYTIVNTDNVIIADATSNTVDITLPAAPTTGQCFTVKCSNDTFTCTVARNGKTIDGDASDVTLIEDEVVELIYDGTGWQII